MGFLDKIKKAIDYSGVVDAAKSEMKKISKSTENTEKAKSDVTVAEITKNVDYEVITDFELVLLENGTYEINKFIGFNMPENFIVPMQIDDKPITKIANGVFCNYTNIKNVQIEEGITYIGKNCFKGCKELEKISIPSTLETITDSLFCDCEKLKEINIPENLVSVEDNAFCGCKRLSIKKFPETLKKIGANSFYACDLGNEENDYQLILPPNLESIGESAFTYSGGYQYIFIPSSVKWIDKCAFSEMGVYESEFKIEKGCCADLPIGMLFGTDIQKLQIPASVTKIDDIFMAKKYVTNYRVVKDEYRRTVQDEYGKEIIKCDGSEQYSIEAPEELTIYCEPGSVAMDYARSNNYSCAKYEE